MEAYDLLILRQTTLGVLVAWAIVMSGRVFVRHWFRTETRMRDIVIAWVAFALFGTLMKIVVLG